MNTYSKWCILSTAQTCSTKYVSTSSSSLVKEFPHLSFIKVRYLPFLPAPDSQFAAVHDYIADLTRKRGFPSCGIIYARTRQSCDELAEFLRGKGMQARPYHRGVPRARLDATLRDWSEGDGCDVVVATVCFGMGIDKADVRLVHRASLAKSRIDNKSQLYYSFRLASIVRVGSKTEVVNACQHLTLPHCSTEDTIRKPVRVVKIWRSYTC